MIVQTQQITAETKRLEMKRLEAAGQWTEAALFKESTRKQLRANGVGREEAVTQSWLVMIEKFGGEPPEPAAMDHFLARLTNPPTINGSEDIDWAFDNLEEVGTQPKHAPSIPAAVALEYSRRDGEDNDPLFPKEREQYERLYRAASSKSLSDRVDAEVEVAVMALSHRFGDLVLSPAVTDAIRSDLTSATANAPDCHG